MPKEMISLLVTRAPEKGQKQARVDVAVFAHAEGPLICAIQSLSSETADRISGEFRSGVPNRVTRPSAPES